MAQRATRINPSGDTGTPRFEMRFLLPRFWATWCALALLRISMHLPRAWLMIIGARIGDWMRRRNHKRRRIAEINLRLCFPQRDAAFRRRILVEHFRHYGRALLDTALVLWASPARIDRLCRLRRGDWLRELARRERVIVVAYHLTTIDITASALARVHPSVAMMRRDFNPLLTWRLWKGRVHLNRANIELIMRDQGLRPMVRALRAGRVCFFIPDEDFGDDKHTVFAPFFGVQTSTLTMVGRLAKLTGAMVVPCATRLDPRSGRYDITLADPLADFPGNDNCADASALNGAMEALIRDAPAQYMWTFRWFKTRPDGAPSPYKSSAQSDDDETSRRIFSDRQDAQRASEGAYENTQPSKRGGATQHSGKKTSEGDV
ncbi:MAG: hypothetical protein ACR2P7_04800 [bacterium]